MVDVLVIGLSASLGQVVCKKMIKKNQDGIGSDQKIERVKNVAKTIPESKF